MTVDCVRCKYYMKGIGPFPSHCLANVHFVEMGDGIITVDDPYNRVCKYFHEKRVEEVEHSPLSRRCVNCKHRPAEYGGQCMVSEWYNIAGGMCCTGYERMDGCSDEEAEKMRKNLVLNQAYYRVYRHDPKQWVDQWDKDLLDKMVEEYALRGGI